MSSGTARPVIHSAAWRISLWATLAFACGTMLVFALLDRFVANEIGRRSDAWLSGEVETLGDVSERTPNDALYNRVVSEVAELALREVPGKASSDEEPANKPQETVFFLQEGTDSAVKLWVGPGDSHAYLKGLSTAHIEEGRPTDIRVEGFSIPFRVAELKLTDGSHIFLGLSERDQLRVLRNMRFQFFLLWLSLVMLGFAIVFFTSRRMLSHVRRISEAASHIGHSGLNTRVPTSTRSDEIAHLAVTLNGMLDRIENSMHQLHTITGALAHDLRSPLTAIRGKLETSVSGMREEKQSDALASAIDELDRLTDFLNKSLDVAEAKADALRLTLSEIDLDEMLNAMIDLYEPSMSEHGLRVKFVSDGPMKMTGDAGLLHRMIANLFDNELKHLRAGRDVKVRLTRTDDSVVLGFEDNGTGFDPEILPHVFVRRVRGRNSSGHGLGLAFVEAVVRAHGGAITAMNAEGGGAKIVISLPVTREERGRILVSAGSVPA